MAEELREVGVAGGRPAPAALRPAGRLLLVAPRLLRAGLEGTREAAERLVVALEARVALRPRAAGRARGVAAAAGLAAAGLGAELVLAADAGLLAAGAALVGLAAGEAGALAAAGAGAAGLGVGLEEVMGGATGGDEEGEGAEAGSGCFGGDAVGRERVRRGEERAMAGR